MQRKLTCLFILLFSILLTSCSSRISTEVFLRDLDDLPNETLTNNLFLHLPLPSMDSCEEYKRRYDSVWRKSRDFRNAEFVKCYEDGMNDFVEYKLAIPLRLISSEEESMQGPVEIIRMDDSASDNRFLYMRVNPKALYRLDQLFDDEFSRSLDLSDTSPLVRISNDLRASQTLVVSHAFVQNVPVINPQKFALEPRDSLDIVLSDVVSAWLFTISSTLPPRIAYLATWLQETEGE